MIKLLFKLPWGQIAQRGMDSFSIVLDFQEVSELAPHLGRRSVVRIGQKLILQRPDEPLHERILELLSLTLTHLECPEKPPHYNGIVRGGFDMNNYLAFVSLSVAGMILLAGCQEQTQRSEKMTESFQNTLEKHHSLKHVIQGDPQRRELEVPGISAAVILPDGTAWLGVSGQSSESEAMNSAMLFGLGSVTKTYIAALVLQLAEEGSLSIEDSIGGWIPELGQIDKEITI